MMKFHVSMPDDLVAQIDKRDTQRSTAIARCLSRYFEMLRRERVALREILSDQEIALILDSCNGVAFYDTISIQLAPMNVADAIEIDGLDAKWEVDGSELMGKLSALSYAGRMALVDAVQCWWERVGNGEQPGFDEALSVDTDSGLPLL